MYFSDARSIQSIILNHDDQFRSLMLVFHNPDITGFANSIDSLPRISNIPTCGLVKLTSDIANWGSWSRSKTQFEYFDYPKNIVI